MKNHRRRISLKEAAEGSALVLLADRKNNIQMPAGFPIEVSLKQSLTLE